MRIYHVPYQYVEYPKWVRLPDGREVVVSDKDAEDALLRGAPPAIEPGTQSGRRPRRVSRHPDSSDLV